MTLPLSEALKFINEVVCRWYGDDLEAKRLAAVFSNDVMAFHVKADFDLGRIPMKCANTFDLNITEDGRIDFLDASRQALKFTISGREAGDQEDLKAMDLALSDQDTQRLSKIEERSKKRLQLKSLKSQDLKRTVAVVKLQRSYRRSIKPKKETKWKVQCMNDIRQEDVPSGGEEGVKGPDR